jgi:hypothetical protein
MNTKTSQAHLTPFVIPGSRKYGETVLPYGLHITTSDGNAPSVIEAAQVLGNLARTGEVTKLLNLHGAVLVRGVGSPSAETFSQLVCATEEARGLKEHEQIGLAGKRTPLAKAIWSANEGPCDRRFYQHNEVWSS